MSTTKIQLLKIINDLYFFFHSAFVKDVYFFTETCGMLPHKTKHIEIMSNKILFQI